MVDYRGQVCIVCNQVFSDDDDIVVCPSCGTPYHRACYKETGSCINHALHQTAGSWQLVKHAEQEEEKRAALREEMMQQAADRQRDGMHDYSNSPMYDGVRMNDDPCLGLDPSEQMDGVTLKEMASFVVSNRFYYLPLFRLMKQTGRKLSFNLSCMLLPEFYFAYRKMWGMTLLSILAQVLFALPSLLYAFQDMTGLAFSWLNMDTTAFAVTMNLASFGEVVFTMLCCFFGNYLYYRFALRKIKGVKKTPAAEETLHMELTEAGGTSAANLVLVSVIWLAIAVVLYLAMMFLR